MARAVTWWLNVSKGDSHTGSTLLTRKVPMAHLPAEGDLVLYLASEEEPNGAINGYVKDRYWDIHGYAHIEFRQVIVDPGPQMPQMPHRFDTYWWTEQDGDIWDYINHSGWEKY